MSNQELSIIIVDDLQFSRIVVKTALKKAGYNGVRLAGSATEALNLLDQKPADVLLADWMMPEMDGLELTRRVRQRDEENGTYTAIILFTAHEGVEYLVRAFDQGVDDYLRKPPDPRELAARVSAAARVAALQNDLLETSRQLQFKIQQLNKMTLVDELTGAGNQHFLLNSLEAHLQEASTRNGGVCLILVELSELDGIRKIHGPNVAYEILISQHRRLRRSVRPTDVVARLDNDCFGIIMHYTSCQDYRTLTIDRILTMIDNRSYQTSAGNLDISGRIGVHFYSHEDEIINAAEMLEMATGKLELARKDETKKIAY
jgi:diguanylate cyclase (GGDEF)-like protein